MKDFCEKFVAEIKFLKITFLNFTVTAILIYRPTWEITLTNQRDTKIMNTLVKQIMGWITFETEKELFKCSGLEPFSNFKLNSF